MSEPGRPRIIESPEEFDRKVNEYVARCRKNAEPLTFTGMALHLGFSARQSLYNYQDYDGFFDSVKRAQLLVENEYEKNLHGNSVTGSIFALKNHGWTDRQEHHIEDAREKAEKIHRALGAIEDRDGE